ncbi:MAG TPA: nucleotide exchange factor GrpE [Anaeromyxobacteraceae bacterium]|nr:nucleotide exchange factor GrpE [Anaeromyxobacteraceae bacterium]
MGQDDGKGSFSANIPKSVLDEALEAVERNEEAAAGTAEGPGEPGALSELERLRAELEMSQAAGREGYEKLREEHDRFLRAAADLENFRKRAQREKEEIQKFGIERVLKDLFPVVDNLDRALAAAPEGDPLAGGVKLVLKTLEDALARHGVKSFHALGEPFDPRRHEAIMTVASADAAPGTVVLEHGRGFSLHDRLVRPALVGVAAAPGEDVPPGGAGPGQGTG